MEVANVIDEKKAKFMTPFEGSSALVDARPELKSEADLALTEIAVPTTRTEAWKYTRVGKIVNHDWNISPSAAGDIKEITNLDAYRAIFVNGIYDATKSNLPNQAGVTCQLLSEASDALQQMGELSDHNSDWLEALNMRYAQEGMALSVEANTTLDKPLYIVHYTDNTNVAAINRHLIQVARGANAEVIVHYVSNQTAKSFQSCVIESFVAENAELQIDKIQEEMTGESYIHATEWTKQARDSRFNIRTVTLSGQWVRNNLNIRVAGENCETHLFGTYMPRAKEHVDNHTMVDHLVPHCESNEVYKGIVTDKATAVFNGKVYVRLDAQKTNAFQQNANIVLSDDAHMYSKPELEIYADDVKCSHGSTTGQFDEEAVYYLRARGIGEASARKLLVQAFIKEIVEAIGDDAVREYCLNRLEERLDQ